MSEPRKAGDFLRQIVREVGQKRTRDAYAQALDDVLSPAQRPHCQVIGFRDGKLTLDGSWTNNKTILVRNGALTLSGA